MTVPRTGHPLARPHRRPRPGARTAVPVAVLAVAVTLLASGCSAGGGSGDAAKVRPGESSGARDGSGPIRPNWVGTWSAAPVDAEPDTYLRGHAGRTFRNVVHTSVGGTRIRVTLSNLFGRTPLHIGRATVGQAAGTDGTVSDAVRARGDGAGFRMAAAAPGSLVPLTFGGADEVTIPPGDEVTSDAADLAVAADADVLVSTYSPESADPSGPVTRHPGARQTSYAAEGDSTGDETGDTFTEETRSWRQLVAVDVFTDQARGSVVAFGASITDGFASTTDANRRWTDFLAERLRKSRSHRMGVLNAGIAGNRLLRNGTGPRALDRFDRDVLSRTGVRVVVIQLGTNDILKAARDPDPDTVVNALHALRKRAHARGIRVIGTTLPPFRGHRTYADSRESVRRSVNARIREGGVFDEVVDFDRVLRDPDAPSRLAPAFDSGDHLHPNDSGYAAMGRTFDLALLG
ncbi:SGNH/GDSL hydrolase family protein [Streptomyces bambusae]|uniref:SGNH/GDSL hydrolase family protein n=1 Tax=Streptomyces bambusae TaxID=1550616 RepID=UPI001CFD9C70|nr:SGNH/GDSL hydrolase family protein [Streptomyces bambusae]MCB5167235.1 SGNH/GDSL hydrolase family protein [Streptomyces bambusae]